MQKSTGLGLWRCVEASSRRWGVQRVRNITGKVPLPFASVLICKYVRQYWVLLNQDPSSCCRSPACDRSPEWHEKHCPMQPVSAKFGMITGQTAALACCLPVCSEATQAVLWKVEKIQFSSNLNACKVMMVFFKNWPEISKGLHNFAGIETQAEQS